MEQRQKPLLPCRNLLALRGLGGVGLGQRLAPSDHVQQKDLGRCLVDLVRAVHVLDEGVPVPALAQLEPPVALVGGLVALRALKEVLRKA